MSEEARRKGQEWAAFLREESPEARARANEEGRRRSEADHARFQEAFRRGRCFECLGDVTHFDKDRPCVHWLLHPPGFTKGHFPEVTARYDCFHLQAFLRWVANEGTFAANINDMRDEGTGKLIELTIRYDTLKWSFSCGEGDFLGHVNAGEAASRPHYHFQMRVNRGAFIRFNDFHVPLSDRDVMIVEAMRADPGLQHRIVGGTGMGEVLNPDTVEAR